MSELWKELCKGASNNVDVDVYGFSKAQIVALAPAPEGIHMTTRLPLDALVTSKFDKKPFDVLVIAFDANPANQVLLAHSCLRTEVSFVLEHLSNSTLLPEQFKRDARGLIAYYNEHPRTPRVAGRPPRLSVDIIYMDPMFEALIVADPVAVRSVFGLEKDPKDWPSSSRSDGRLDQLFSKMITVGKSAKGAKLPHFLRGDAKSNKHGFALEAVRKAGGGSPLWSHPITSRLRTVVVC